VHERAGDARREALGEVVGRSVGRGEEGVAAEDGGDEHRRQGFGCHGHVCFLQS
jgi:hypothetical protein